MVKNPFANAGDVRDTGPSLGWEDPLEEKVVTRSSILAWRVPWTEEPGGLQSIRLQRLKQLGAHTQPPQALLICDKGHSLRSTVSSPEKPTFHYKLRNTEVVYPLTGAWNHVS